MTAAVLRLRLEPPQPHLRRVLREYVAYYNADRTHVAFDQHSPATRPVLPHGGRGKVIALPRVRR